MQPDLLEGTGLRTFRAICNGPAGRQLSGKAMRLAGHAPQVSPVAAVYCACKTTRPSSLPAGTANCLTLS